MSIDSKLRSPAKWISFDIIASSILPRLPVKSLARFRCVCKQWCSLTYDPHFALEHLKRASETVGSITVANSFFLSSKKIPLYNFALTDGNFEIEDCSFHINLGDGALCTLSNSVNGLICAFYWEGRYGRPYLFNPAIRQVSPLPKIRNVPLGGEISSSEFVLLGYDGSTGEYKVVRSHNKTSVDCCYFEVLTLGTQIWRRVDGEAPCIIDDIEVLFLNGAFYWPAVRHEQGQPPVTAILVFDVKEESFRFISVPKGVSNFHTLNSLSVRKLDGHICLVQNPVRPTQACPPPLSAPILSIWKLEGDYVNHKWDQIHAINMSEWADAGEMYKLCNSVYVIDVIQGKLLIQKSRVIYSYDIQNGTLQALFDVSSYDIQNGTPQALFNMSSHPALLVDVFKESLIAPSSLLSS